jgi:hypothetical protein
MNEVCALIELLIARNGLGTEIHCQPMEVSGEDFVS